MTERDKKEQLLKIGVPGILMPSALACLQDNFPVEFIRETSSSGILVACREKTSGEISEFFFFYLTTSTWELVNRAEASCLNEFPLRGNLRETLEKVVAQRRDGQPQKEIPRNKPNPPKT